MNAPTRYDKDNHDKLVTIERDVKEIKDSLKTHCEKEDANGVAIAEIKSTMATKKDLDSLSAQVRNNHDAVMAAIGRIH